MKKEEIDQELINLAYLRWNFIREKEEYKKDFKQFIDENPEQKANPLIFDNFTRLPKESFSEFKERVVLYLAIITYEKDAETIS